MLAAMMFAAALFAGDPEPPTAPMPMPAPAAGQPGGQPAAPAAPPPPQRDSYETCRATFQDLVETVDSNPARALTLLKRIEGYCDLPPELADSLPAMHAYLELELGHPKAAIAALDGHPTPRESSFWPLAGWARLSALEMLGDAPGYRSQRDTLVAANLAAIAAGPQDRLRRREHFETPTASIDVFEGRVVKGRAIRILYFVAVPKNGGGIVTVVLELDPQATDTSEKLTRYLVNAYSCAGGKEFISSASGPGGAGPPSYETTKALAISTLARKGTIRPFAKPASAQTCSFNAVMLPGLPDPE